MHFLNPIFLWGLLGLSIPIGIHLLSRKEGKVIKLGSLRHLTETSTKQFKGIKLNELLLLSLRCLLIILFCLLLSGLYWNATGTKKWVVIEKGIESKNRALLDSLKNNGYELRWLSKGIPELNINDTTGATSDINYSQTIEELDRFQVAEAIIFAKNDPSKLVGGRFSLPSNIRWISVLTDPHDYTLFSRQLKPDSNVVRKGHSDYMRTSYTDEKTSSRDNTDLKKKITVALVSDDLYLNDKRIIKAALEAIEESLYYYDLNITEIQDANHLQDDSAQWIVWLSDKTIPENSSGIISLDLQPARELFVQTAENHWRITKRLTEEIGLKENLTLRLADVITTDKNLIHKAAEQNDRRMIPDSIAWSAEPVMAGASASILQTPASPWLLGCLFLILLIERIIAYHRNQ